MVAAAAAGWLKQNLGLSAAFQAAAAINAAINRGMNVATLNKMRKGAAIERPVI
jgi:hypothetical protein